jgi:hypothetical protein
MIKRYSKKTVINVTRLRRARAKLQSKDTDFTALMSLIRKASDMSALGQKLIAMADQMTEGAGVLAKRTGHSVEDACLRLARARA